MCKIAAVNTAKRKSNTDATVKKQIVDVIRLLNSMPNPNPLLIVAVPQ